MILQTLRPMLEVNDMEASIAYYQNTLGFSCTNRLHEEWALMERDGVGIMLSARMQRQQHLSPTFTGSLYVYTDEVDTFWEEWSKKVDVSYPIETFDYGMREFGFFDCNGYLLQLGQIME